MNFNTTSTLRGLTLLFIFVGILLAWLDSIYSQYYFIPLPGVFSRFFIHFCDAFPFILLLALNFFPKVPYFVGFQFIVTTLTFILTVLVYFGRYTIDDPYILVDDRWGQFIYPLILGCIIFIMHGSFWIVHFLRLYFRNNR